MTHLTPTETIDLLDGVLDTARARHVDGCAPCRETVDAVRNAHALSMDVEIPEPSPLFWEHFSVRVSSAVRDADDQPTGWLGWAGDAPVMKWALSGALLTLLLVAGLWRASAPAVHTPASRTTVASIADHSGSLSLDLPADDAAGDEAWGLVRTVADEVAWDDDAVERLGVGVDSADRAVAMLSVDERSELVRLLEAEMKQPGA